MINIYKNMDENVDSFKAIETTEPGCWINLTAPTDQELLLISKKTGVSLEFLKSSLDEEETSRIDQDNNGNIMIIVDIPFSEMEDNSLTYDTYPLGIIHTEKELITVCLKNSKILNDFVDGKIKSFYTFKKSRFTLQILYRIATYYLIYLRQIDKKSHMIEKRLHKSTKNKELIQLLSLENSLVYFSTSLKANEITLEKMLKMEIMQKYPDDHDVLEDVIIENKQAIEMATIYSNILSGTMDAFASIISNNIHSFIKLLLSIMVSLMLPLMIFSLFSMNIMNPLSSMDYGFYIILAIAILGSGIIAIILGNRNSL